MNKNKLSKQDIEKIIQQNRVIFAYPKKGYFSVDGFQKFSADASTFKFFKDLKKNLNK
jgi:hypothetical protein